MPSLSNGISVEVSRPPQPSVEAPGPSDRSVTVVPVRGAQGDVGPVADVDDLLVQLEPPVALDLLYVNGTI